MTADAKLWASRIWNGLGVLCLIIVCISASIELGKLDDWWNCVWPILTLFFGGVSWALGQFLKFQDASSDRAYDLLRLCDTTMDRQLEVMRNQRDLIGNLSSISLCRPSEPGLYQIGDVRAVWDGQRWEWPKVESAGES